MIQRSNGVTPMATRRLHSMAHHAQMIPRTTTPTNELSATERVIPRMSNPKMSNPRMSNPKMSNAKMSNSANTAGTVLIDGY